MPQKCILLMSSPATIRKLVKEADVVVGAVLIPGAKAPMLVTGAVAKTSTLALTNATLSYAVEIANKGWKKAVKENREIMLGANVVKGKVTCKGVAEAFGLECVPIDKLL